MSITLIDILLKFIVKCKSVRFSDILSETTQNINILKGKQH